MPPETGKSRILVCHNRYQLAGGEDAVVDMETRLLRDHGHVVRLHELSNDVIASLADKVRAGLHVAWSEPSRKRLLAILDEFRPDIVHIHNFFPLLTPSAYAACIEKQIPVVQTLHNYRIICPGAMLMRNGKVCELCVRGTPWHGTLHHCYRNSVPQSFAVSHLVSFHRRHDTWNRKVDRLIALTAFARSKFIEAGISPDRIVVKPNFIHQPCCNSDTPSPQRQPFALYVGRIAAEKGVATLVAAFNQTGIALKIAGSGPLQQHLQKNSGPNIEWLGHQGQQKVLALMQQARFLVMPSECYEGFPLVILEAFANRLPVLCSRLGSMAEIVEDHITGRHFLPGNVTDLAATARMLFDNPAACAMMGSNAHQEYLARYTPEQNYRMLVAIYRDVIDANP